MARKIETEVLSPTVEKIDTSPLPDVLKKYFRIYADYVISDRALPDMRDGLKPSQRRVLVAMNDLGLLPNGKYSKSAKICGTCSGDYHPHGEAVVYPTMVRMAQDWVCRYCLIEGQGNYGNINGEPPAAMRYTEARLSPFGSLLLEELSPDVVDYISTYNDEKKEPIILPSRIPNLLINGASGIAVGFATEILPHNYVEAANLITAYVKNNKLTIDDIMAIMPGPDFPTGGILRGQDGVRDYYKTGKGSIVLEGIYNIKRTPKDNYVIEITGVPYQVSPDALTTQIRALSDARIIETVLVEDYSNRKDEEINISIIIEVPKTANIDNTIAHILKSTDLRVKMGINQTVLIENKVVENVPIIKFIESFVKYRSEVLIKKFNAELIDIKGRLHIIEGLLSAIKNIDAVVELIKKSKSPNEAIIGMIEAKYVNTEDQAKAVLSLRLSKLTRLETDTLVDESSKLQSRVKFIDNLLSSNSNVYNFIAKEQRDLAKEFGGTRKTEISTPVENVTVKVPIIEEKFKLNISWDGFIKKQVVSQDIPIVGFIEGEMNDDYSKDYLATSSSVLLVFTDKGQLYRKQCSEIPVTIKNAKGTHIHNVIDLPKDEHVLIHALVSEFREDQYVVVGTSSGLLKKTAVANYATTQMNRVFNYQSLEDGDEVVSVLFVNPNDSILCVDNMGCVVRYNENTIAPKYRTAQGVAAMKLVDSKMSGVFKVNNKQSLVLKTDLGYVVVVDIKHIEEESRMSTPRHTISIQAGRNGKMACMTVSNPVLYKDGEGNIQVLDVNGLKSIKPMTLKTKTVILGSKALKPNDVFI
jgi:DNA gyrase subunit A